MSAAEHPAMSPPPPMPVNGRGRRLPPRVPSPNIVSVIFFESPETFFVVRSSNDKAFDQIANTLGEMEWELGTDHRVVGEPELGELYVTRCTYDDRYYRIMALEFHVEEKVGLGHYTLCEFIDIGARKWILTERLRTIPSDLVQYPPLAEECCLDGVLPNGPGGQWKQEAIERFVTTVEDDGECLMMVNDDRPEGAPEYPLKVDLLCRFKRYSSDRSSLKMSLIWSNLAWMAPMPRKNSRNRPCRDPGGAPREVGNGNGSGGGDEGHLEG